MVSDLRYNGFYLILAAGLATSVLPTDLRADDDAPPVNKDKSQYNLFNVTPSDQLRPLALDENDGVADPTTVDAGYVEAQTDLIDYYHYDTSFGPTVFGPGGYGPTHLSESHYAWAPRITLGVLNNVAVFIHPSFQTTSYQYSGRYNFSGDNSGYTGMNIGAKVNLWGNDGGVTALAIAPYVSIPNGVDNFLGGADIPFAIRLPHHLYLKFEVNPYAFEYNHTVYFGLDNGLSLHESVGNKLDIYGYLNTSYRSDVVPWYGYAGFGFGYLVSRNFEIYMSIGFGLTDNSYDYNPRLGLAYRF